MAAGIHRDFVRMALDNALATPLACACSGPRWTWGGSMSTRTSWRGQTPRCRLTQRLPLDAAARRRQPVRALDESSHIQALINPGAEEARQPSA
jgi:hypothetical protein